VFFSTSSFIFPFSHSDLLSKPSVGLLAERLATVRPLRLRSKRKSQPENSQEAFDEPTLQKEATNPRNKCPE